jgi:hypothetical protein
MAWHIFHLSFLTRTRAVVKIHNNGDQKELNEIKKDLTEIRKDLTEIRKDFYKKRFAENRIDPVQCQFSVELKVEKILCCSDKKFTAVISVSYGFQGFKPAA